MSKSIIKRDSQIINELSSKNILIFIYYQFILGIFIIFLGLIETLMAVNSIEWENSVLFQGNLFLGFSGVVIGSIFVTGSRKYSNFQKLVEGYPKIGFMLTLLVSTTLLLISLSNLLMVLPPIQSEEFSDWNLMKDFSIFILLPIISLPLVRK